MALAGLAEGGRVIVAGDDRQLPPVTPTTAATTASGHALGGSLYAFLKSAGTSEFPLNETYRLNGPLAAPVGELFYDGNYHSVVPQRRLSLREGWQLELEPWQRQVLDPENPVCVLLYDGPASGTDNPLEREVLKRLVELLAPRIRPPKGQIDWDLVDLWNRGLAVITPHRTQNAALRDQLVTGPFGPNAVVETVERMQGRERDAILAGYVVSDPEFAQLEADFLFSPYRLNVLVSRARGKLVLLISRVCGRKFWRG